MADRPLTDLTPAEILQVALDDSTTEQRCDEAWVAALAARVRAARPDDRLSSTDPAVMRARLDALLAAARAEAATLDQPGQDTEDDDALLAIAYAVGVAPDTPRPGIVAAVRAALNPPPPAAFRHIHSARRRRRSFADGID